MKTFLFPFLASVSVAALPSVGPDYRRPEVPAPAAYRDAVPPTSGDAAGSADSLGGDPWWKKFADPQLDLLESRALAANQDLRAAAARVEEARAEAGIARGAFWPNLAAGTSASRGRTSSTTGNPLPQPLTTDYAASANVSWELDLFGRVRRLNESANADASASAATFAAVRLALAADVATYTFSLRASESELAILQATVALRRRAAEVVGARRKDGTATDLDAARAAAELASAEADADAVAIRSSALQDGLAALVGEPASSFMPELAPDEHPRVPTVAPGLPSELLGRRPDVAAAERKLVAANARIGVAKAAFFPAISLTGAAGYESGESARLFHADSRIWSIGPSLYLPIFQGGRNRANLDRSRAAYDEAVAAFRQRVLVAFQEVQDALTASRLLAEQAAAEDRELTAARRAAQLAQVRFDAGYVSYLEVIDAQRTALTAERTSVQLTAARLNASVTLIKALGGS